MKAIAFCYRHPAQLARRYCFQCERSICQTCQIKLDHHLFCGNPCHQEYLEDAAAETKNSFLRYGIYATLTFVLCVFVYFGLLADAFYSGGNHQATPNRNSIALSLPVNVNEKIASPITILRPLNGERIMTQRIQVEGIAPENAEVSLYLNGMVLDKTTAHSSHYRFTNILLPQRANVIQTRFYTPGTSEASTAIMVFRKALQD